ncbi:Transcriptional regulatory protein, C terminal [Sulfobacillus thermosulfidooxidans DSM 9293]|uniref:Transcriptional regulatory protein, C terminal n=1 Tax=Sulfobacillus thermosulfidooxidans (strain DSM 9293 / VKM B-1269 / AT-1) TaxID=929705 RepID=A0A1W1W728_SULTA|nr:winged helix-turn-helix domain-containing protein [Sulfobacillus thermosulfidooxidans]SMC02094.1 Transcriptional regulatory protein, C terminal [Sulfobacillus thermosulfidooxidans DSM 9293]
MRCGYVSPEPLSHYLPTAQALVPIRRFETINQILHALIHHQITCLAINVQGLPDTATFSAVLETAETEGIPILLLTHYLQSKMWQITPVQSTAPMLSQFTQSPTPSCLTLWPVVRHHHHPVDLAPRAIALLSILATYADQVLSLSQINEEAQHRGIPPWTAQSLRVTVHHLNHHLRPLHIVTHRGYGYRFIPCADAVHASNGHRVPNDETASTPSV